MVSCNPELTRNYWLDFRLQRVILGPVIISIIIYIAYLTNFPFSPQTTASILAYFFIFFWGIKNASETVIDEIRSHTWDFQRQTSLSPFSMMCGKLFGSTLYSWYCTFFCFFYYTIFIKDPILFHLKDIFIIIMGGLFGQTLALLLSLQVIPHALHENSKLPTFYYFFLALIISLLTTTIVLGRQREPLDLHWFQFTFSIDIFAFTSLAIFTLWALLGLYRSFCAALQYQRPPFAWIAFNIFVIMYFAGLSNIYFDLTIISSSLPTSEFLDLPDFELLLDQAPTYMAFFIAQALFYIILVTETLNVVVYEKMIYRIRSHLYFQAFERLPLWPISFLLVIVTGGLTIYQLSGLSQAFTKSFSPVILISSIVALTFRDVLLFHCLSFSTKIRRVGGAFIIYLFLLYILFPTLLKALDVRSLNVIFLPSWGDHFSVACAGISIQILLLIFMIKIQLRRL